MLNLNLNEFPADNDFEPIPQGEYPMNVVVSEIKENREKTSKYINCKCRIVDGPMEGRTIYTSFSVWHPVENSRKIAKRMLVSLMASVGLCEKGSKEADLKDINDLCGKTFVGKVIHKQSEAYGTEVRLQSFKKLENRLMGQAQSNSFTF